MIATLARASIEGALLVVMVWLLARLLRLSPATRTMLWWCAAAKFIIALAWTAPIEIPVLPARPAAVVASIDRVVVRPISDESVRATPPRRDAPIASSGSLATEFADGLREWSSVAAIGWVLGLTALVLAGLRRWRMMARLLRESTPAPSIVQAEAAELAGCVGLRRVPAVRVSSSVETPLVTGLLRPVVLLPADRLDSLSDQQRRMVICHELAHVRRADLWLGCVPALAERVFFFHPLAQVAAREYALAREAACDMSVMRTLDAAPQDYGKLLLALGVSPSRRSLTAAGAAWSFQNLKRRISMLQDISVRSKGSRLVTAAIVALAVGALLPLRLVARPSPAQMTQQPGPSADVDLHSDSAGVQAEKDPQTTKSEPSTRTRAMRFVLLSQDGSRTTSDASDSDVAQAERQRRNGEALLWFRVDDKAYVIRDPEVLREARALWTGVSHHPHFDADAVRELTQSLESLNVDGLAQQGALLAQTVTESGIADHAQLLGSQAAELGLMVAGEVLHGLSHGGITISDLDETRLDKQLHSIDTSALEHHMEALEKSADHLGEQIEHSMRGLEHQLNGDLDLRLKDLESHLRDLDFDHFGEVGRTASGAASHATEEMRALIDRAIKTGQASLVR